MFEVDIEYKAEDALYCAFSLTQIFSQHIDNLSYFPFKPYSSQSRDQIDQFFSFYRESSLLLTRTVRVYLLTFQHICSLRHYEKVVQPALTFQRLIHLTLWLRKGQHTALYRWITYMLMLVFDANSLDTITQFVYKYIVCAFVRRICIYSTILLNFCIIIESKV